MGDRLQIGIARQRSGSQDLLDFRSEIERALKLSVVKRLHTKAVAGTEKKLFAAIPKSKCPHSVKTLKTVPPPDSIRVENNFRVGVGAKFTTGVFEFTAELFVVVDFAVVGDREIAVGGLHRLIPGGGNVQDREAAIAEANGGGCGERPRFLIMKHSDRAFAF